MSFLWLLGAMWGFSIPARLSSPSLDLVIRRLPGRGPVLQVTISRPCPGPHCVSALRGLRLVFNCSAALAPPTVFYVRSP